MSTENKVFNKLFSSEKIELESQKFELGITQDAIKDILDARKEFQAGADIIYNARSKAETSLKKSIVLANTFFTRINEIKKISKELGIDVPSDILKEEDFGKATLSSATSLLKFLNQLERE